MIGKCYNNVRTDNNNNNKETKILKNESSSDLLIREKLSQDIINFQNDNSEDYNINKDFENSINTQREINILDDNLVNSYESLHISNDIKDSSTSLSECSLQLSVSSFEQTSLENLIMSEENSNENFVKDYTFEKESQKINDNKKLVMEEIEKIECKLPELDFKKIEETLHNSAIEHDMISRRLLGDQVRRRLALQYEELICEPSPPINTYPKKSNFGERLQAANKLQICYLNELHYENNTSQNCSNTFYKTKSKSAPNIKSNHSSNKNIYLNKPFLIPNSSKEIYNNNNNEINNEIQKKPPDNKKSYEILLKAKESVKLQFDFEKKAGRFISCKDMLNKKFTRIELTKKNNLELINLYNELQRKVDTQNNTLVKLLIERDILHMQQDSLICDIDDLLHSRNSTKQISKLPNFMSLEDDFLEEITEDKEINDNNKSATAHNTPRAENDKIFGGLKLSNSYPAGFLNIFGFFKK
ncbi:Schwannomin interacting protein 1 family-containing protein [Strongyloides ratti]|uniref:Schwannomin interacting protein 1 family-containing protein n=1 Tax=Strongyloides ratti TaxID=34506 RepID=A0A090L4H3_STRRB|nr:Schwannomin interacting protein 1 family-containing protein [Strongyloides ratti]CEF63022.1 Schwannomin interacting protein 1 family-containing protein [Strongyloides ratti]